MANRLPRKWDLYSRRAEKRTREALDSSTAAAENALAVSSRGPGLSPPAHANRAPGFSFRPRPRRDEPMNRAVLFVDGSNFFHGCSQLGLRGLARLNYARLSAKLVESRSWCGTRYYVGEVPRAGDLRLAAHQERFLDTLRSTDPRISVHLGRIEPRRSTSEAARALKRYLGELKIPLDPSGVPGPARHLPPVRGDDRHGGEGRRRPDRCRHGDDGGA